MIEGRVQVYTGDGKGKTTAALGLVVRAAGHGLKSYIGQFMKGQPYGELLALADHPLVGIEQYGSEGCIRRDQVTAEHRAQARRGLEAASAAMLSGDYDIVVLDEINVALWFDLLSIADVSSLIERRPANVELVFTGRRAPDELIARADLVTEMREVKHYFASGISARAGIEF